ncbi:MAG: GDP-mannose 4,6-dehydratase, partial [Deltaproteobacteria bacterium]|nr:GDP-mannose 4,6-dehydratase [Deltaproteobacteria bacterium]
QQEKPKDYVVSTGKQHSVRDFVNIAGKELGFDIRWEGEGVNEKGYDQKTDRCIVEVDPRYFRPTEVDALLGDSSLAREELGWEPKTSFEEMIAEMVTHDLREAERDLLCRREGFFVPNTFE